MADLKPTGRNLIKNSDNGYFDTGEVLSFYPNDKSKYSYVLQDDKWYRMSWTTGGFREIVQSKVVGIPITGTYTFSIHARAPFKPKCDVTFFYDDAHHTVNAGVEEIGENEYLIQASYKLDAGKRLRVVDLRQFSGWPQNNSYIEFRYPKLELGTEATPWTPAPEDSLSGGGTNMILAFDVITLATVTDVQGIYRFYQLATSKPSKPTTYPPASAWADEMPGYQLGNQDSLYFVDVTVFNDLTYQYGEVQLSTDYEAVKATYADALQQIANAEKQMQSEIQKTNESIRAEVSEDYYKKDQTDDLLGTISTALEQTKDSFTMQFNSFQADLENVNADNSAKFQELYQYIRFKGGSIELGETGNTITLTIENDRISFKQAGQEIAYMSNNQLYITDANIVTSLRIGNFIFSPRPNGSLDFKKVGA